MIYYFCPDHDVPSWGVGMLYYHVHFLNANDIKACILHNKTGFKLSWLNLNIPIVYMQNQVRPKQDDIMIVPEFYVEDSMVKGFKCRKILFVQNSFILFERISPKALNAFDYESAFYYMPHLKKILSAYFSAPIYETPAFIADYFYTEPALLHTRKKHIIIYPKTDSRDYNIIERLLADSFEQPGIINTIIKRKIYNNEWKVIVMKNFTHKQAAQAMQQAAFFINLNTHEAFNSSVPEAMAAGCINFTYDAFGPADFLQDNINAFVFNNNHVFDLYEKLQYFIKHFEEDGISKELISIREKAFATAKNYTAQLAEKAIVKVFSKLIV